MPLITSGARLTPARLNALRPLAVYKTAHTDRVSTTSHSDDPHLTLAVAAATVYVGRLVLFANSAASAAGDLSIRFNMPSGSEISFGINGLDPAVASGVSADLTTPMTEWSAAPPTSALNLGLSSSFTLAQVDLLLSVGATAGSLTLQWAQAAISANLSRLRKNSYMLLHQIS